MQVISFPNATKKKIVEKMKIKTKKYSNKNKNINKNNFYVFESPLTELVIKEIVKK